MTRTDQASTFSGLSRRALLGMGAGSILISVTPLTAFATPEEVTTAQEALFGDTPVREGRVTLKMPPIAENGYSVPLDISVDSPMTASDHVRRIAIFSPRNPAPLIAIYKLGPRAGKAGISTRIRLGGTQDIQVIVEMNDGSLWSGTVETVVTLAACVVL